MKAIVRQEEVRAQTDEELFALLKAPAAKDALKEILRPMILAG